MIALLDWSCQLAAENKKLSQRAWMLQRLVDAHNMAGIIQACHDHA